LKTKNPKLKYSFLNEDPNCELKIVPPNAKTITCIAGSGFRLLPFLSLSQIKTIYIVDQSKAQLDNTRKILDLLNEPDYESFVQQLNPTSAKSFLYSGQHEQSCILRARLLSLFFFGQFKPDVDLTQTLRWPLFVKTYAHFLKVLKKDSSLDINYASYLTASFKKLISTPYRQNFFWQQFLYGHAKTMDAFTALVPEKNWVAAKNNVGKIDIHYVEHDIVDFLATKTNEIDFISFSNVINYLSDTKKSLLVTTLEKSLRISGQIFLRSYIDPILLKSSRLVEVRTKIEALETEMTGSYVMKVYEKI